MPVTDDVVLLPADTAPRSSARPDRGARAAAVLGLAVTAWIHAPLVPQHWSEVPYLGAAFAVLVVVSATLAGSLLVESARATWVLALLLTAGAVVLYVVSRSVGPPGAADDVGEWTDVAGVVAVAAELVVATTAATVLRRRRVSR